MTLTPQFRAARRISYAQNMEDILLDRFFGDRLGTFVDVGAHHPLHDNNTYFFYERGWRGVNLEPIPQLHRLLQQYRPGDLNLVVAAGDCDGELPFYEITTCRGLSTVSAQIAADHQARGAAVVPRSITARTLARLIQEHRIAPPDFLSIDVEGHEPEVIRGIPLATWRPQVLVVESTRPLSTIGCHETWEPMLVEQGYLFATFNGINRFYVRDDLAHKLELLRVPVNVLDHYERWETVLLRQQVAELQQQIQRLQTAATSQANGFLVKPL